MVVVWEKRVWKKNIKDEVLSWYLSLCPIAISNWHKVPQNRCLSLSFCQREFDLQYLNMKNWAHIILPVFLYEDLHLVVHSLHLNTPWWSLPLSIDKISLFSPWLKKRKNKVYAIDRKNHTHTVTLPLKGHWMPQLLILNWSWNVLSE